MSIRLPLQRTGAAPARKPGSWRKWLMYFGAITIGLGLLWAGYLIYRQLAFRPQGEIAFSCLGTRQDSHGYPIRQICLVNADGSNRRQLTDLPSDARMPAWSADGKEIVFGHGGFLATMNADGSQFHTIQPSEVIGADWPAWSPDGTRFAFVWFTSERSFGVFVINRDGNNLTQIADADRAPVSWSPDGQWIAFTSSTGNSYAVSVTGTAPLRRLANQCSFRSWSPDGTRIVCVWNSRFWSVRVVDGQSTLIKGWFLVNSQYNHPSWSPDGQYLAYQQINWRFFMASGGELWITTVDGAVSRQLTPGPGDMHPAWRPTVR